MKRLILLAASLLLTSCFDVREEITVAADVSGHLRFDYTVPKEALPCHWRQAGHRRAD